MSDVLSLLLLIRNLANRIATTSALIKQMREEGRENLTDEEKQQLKDEDDEARAALVEAIENVQQP